MSRHAKALSVVLPPNTLRHLASSLKKQWRRYRKALKSCQDNFSTAAVHESRVDTRRLLSIVGLLSPFLAPGRAAKMQLLLKKHLDSFDDLRDTQVQLLATGKLKRKFTAARRFCEYLLKRERQFSRQTLREIKRIKTKRLGKWVGGCRDDLKKWEETDLTYAANALLLRMVHAAFARTQRLYDQIDPKDTKTIHRTRIAFKKFRYMVEIITRDLPRADKTQLRAMHDHQTMMGDIQDAQVLLATYKEFLRKKKIEPKAARAFRQHLLQTRKELIQIYLRGAHQLLEFWPTSAAAPRKVAVAPRSTWRSPRREQTSIAERQIRNPKS